MPVANRTLKQIINEVQKLYGLDVSETVINNSDKTTVQLLAFAQEELEALGKKNWKSLTFEHNLVVSVPVETTGNTTANSAVVTNIPDTSSLEAHFWSVSGPNIPVGARILSVDSATQVTLTMQVTGATTGAELLFAKDMYPEPDDFDHFIGDTWYDRTNRWKLLGPLSPQLDQLHLSGIVAFGPRRFFRSVGPYANTYRIWPPPAEIVSPLQLVYEYKTNHRVRVNGSQTEFAFLFANDGDIPLINDRLIIAGIKWRFWEQKGFNWLSKRKEYENMVDQEFARDGGMSKLNMAAMPMDSLLSPMNVQDGNFPAGPNTLGTSTT